MVAIHDEDELDDSEDGREREQEHHVDGVGSVQVVSAAHDAGEREEDDGVRREHVAQEALKDEVVEDPPGDDLHREDGQRHGAADLRFGARPVLEHSGCSGCILDGERGGE